MALSSERGSAPAYTPAACCARARSESRSRRRPMTAPGRRRGPPACRNEGADYDPESTLPEDHTAMSIPFRADQVGSLLRPEALAAERQSFKL